VTTLHARVDLLEGQLRESLVGAGAGLRKRAFAVLRLTRTDGTTGLGEASPLPGYSPDSIEEASRELRELTEHSIEADPLATPPALLSDALAAHSMQCPSSRFAVEAALLDWLGRTRLQPLHEVLAGQGERSPIPIADLVAEPNPASWPSHVDALVEDGATHVKMKIGSDLDAEVAALQAVRRAHPTLPIRLDANRRLSPSLVIRHAGSLESLELELMEEPVAAERWLDVIDLPLPFALDETLGEQALSQRLLETGAVRAVVLKPTVLGGLRASFEVAERAAEHGVPTLVSHTFEGPIARAATAELALALQTELAAGLGAHPALELWPDHQISAIVARQIVPHRTSGLGLRFDEDPDG
jgi:o-succinylbenzoate synthase